MTEQIRGCYSHNWLSSVTPTTHVAATQGGDEIMLVLTRKRMETIRIGDDITIQVIQTGRGRVKLGIQAPAHLRVLRGELEVIESALAGLADASYRRSNGRPWDLVHEFGNN